MDSDRLGLEMKGEGVGEPGAPRPRPRRLDDRARARPRQRSARRRTRPGLHRRQQQPPTLLDCFPVRAWLRHGGRSRAAGLPNGPSFGRANTRAQTKLLSMAEPASPLPTLGEESPSLDPAAIELAYLRERARRRRRVAHREYARNSNARFWVMLAVLALITVLIGLAAFHEIQTNFGVFQPAQTSAPSPILDGGAGLRPLLRPEPVRLAPGTCATARVTPLPAQASPPSRSSTASCSPVDAPEGCSAESVDSRPTSTSTVGLPRESRIWRA